MKINLWNQRGYLFEIPLLFAAVIIVLFIVIPHLSPIGQKIIICLAAIPILFFLYYMIVIPGWMPGDKRRLKPPWNIIVFVLIATVIIFAAIMIALHPGAVISG
ncbi:MAG TPA: hypothetical protein VMU29_06310 [Smithella sp.]|nr:hypothetical protein [Smithella sp.]